MSTKIIKSEGEWEYYNYQNIHAIKSSKKTN